MKKTEKLAAGIQETLARRSEMFLVAILRSGQPHHTLAQTAVVMARDLARHLGETK